MIKFLSKLPFLKLIYRQGGIDSFALAQKDILSTMTDDLDKKAEDLARKKLNDLLSPVDLNSIVTINKPAGAIYIGGKRVDDSRLATLKSEAEFFLASDLWLLINETPKELAHKAMFVSGEGIDDMKKGRSILYTLSSQRNVIEVFKSYQQKKPIDKEPGSQV